MSRRIALNLGSYEPGSDEFADAWVLHAVPALARELGSSGGEPILLARPSAVEQLGSGGAEVRPLHGPGPPSAAALDGADVLLYPLSPLDHPDPRLPVGALAPGLPRASAPDATSPARAERDRRLWQLAIAGAARLLTFTNLARDQLVAAHGVDPERVAVVRPGPRAELAEVGDEAAFQALAMPADYLLARADGDQLSTLMEAVSLLGSGPAQPHLVLTGTSLAGTAELRAQADALGIGGRVRLAGRLPARAVPLVMRRARAVVDCATNGAFPVLALDAATAGTPVLTLPGTPAEEIGGACARLASGRGAAELAEAIERASGERAPGPGSNGFSWEATAATLAAVARSMGGERIAVRREPPAVSVVTPTLNMATFLQETIESVLSQDYPRLEYVVMDGGSTDGTVELLRSYGDRLRFVSRQDDGQADAVNRGFRETDGELFAFLNADDTYRPGAVATAVRGFLAQPGAAVVYGDGVHVDEQGAEIGPYPTKPFDREALMRRCYICQPAAFISRSALERVGPLDTHLQVALDYELWIRLAKLYPFAKIDGLLATSRMHSGNKTLAQRRLAYREGIQVVKRHFGYVPLDWLDSYSQFRVEGVDQFFSHSRPGWRSRVLALAMGARHNPAKFGRLWREWATEAGLRDHDARWEDGWISRRYVDEVDVPSDCRVVRVRGRHDAWMKRPLELSVHLNGVMVAHGEVPKGEPFELAADCPPDMRGRRARLEIVANRTWHPRARGDRRRVSCVIDEVRLD